MTLFYVSVLNSEDRSKFFLATLSALARIAQAFPPLCDDVISLLVSLGKICSSHLANAGAAVALPSDDGKKTCLFVK